MKILWQKFQAFLSRAGLAYPHGFVDNFPLWVSFAFVMVLASGLGATYGTRIVFAPDDRHGKWLGALALSSFAAAATALGFLIDLAAGRLHYDPPNRRESPPLRLMKYQFQAISAMLLALALISFLAGLGWQGFFPFFTALLGTVLINRLAAFITWAWEKKAAGWVPATAVRAGAMIAGIAFCFSRWCLEFFFLTAICLLAWLAKRRINAHRPEDACQALNHARRQGISVVFLAGTIIACVSFSPGQASAPILALVMTGLTTYAALAMVLKNPLRWAAFALLTGMIIGGFNPYKLRIKDLTYSPPPPAGSGGPPLLDNTNIGWANTGGTQMRPLVIVCASGGGAAAAYWTLLNLAALETNAPDFPYHIRIITGASGGMLGAAYYASTLMPPASQPATSRHAVAGQPVGLDEMCENMTADYLSGPLNRLAFKDVPYLFWPGAYSDHRGEVLQKAWEDQCGGALAKPLSALYEEEKAGWMPSLIFSPTLTKKRLPCFISNLNLSALTSIPILNGSRQLFQEIPDARAHLRISTACRLNATFPYVSPACVLPTPIDESLVDAGYYDNHGVVIASEWLRASKEWLKNHASEIILIRFRTFAADDYQATAPGRWLSSVQELATPVVTGLIRGSRDEADKSNERFLAETEAMFRNENLPQIHLFNLECYDQNVSLTWKLSRQDVETMRKAARDTRNQEAITAIVGRLRSENSGQWMEDKGVSRIMASGVLRIGLSGTEELLGWRIQKLEKRDLSVDWDGFEIRLAHEIAKKLTGYLSRSNSIQVQIVEKTWNDLLYSLQKRDVDVVISSMSYEPSREDRYGVSFSTPYLHVKMGMAWMGDESFEPDWTNAVLGVQSDTTGEEVALSIARATHSTVDRHVIRADRLQDSLWALAQGRLTCVIGDYPDILEFQNTHSNVRVKPLDESKLPKSVPEYLIDQEYSVAVNQEDARLVRLVNQAITELSMQFPDWRKEAEAKWKNENEKKTQSGEAFAP